MATPQTEDGYTKIANELLEAFSKIDASGSAWRVFMVVLRKTYGYHKKKDSISLTQFEQSTGMTRKGVAKGLNELEQKNIIVRCRDTYITSYEVNKNYHTWGSVQNDTSVQLYTKTSVQLYTKTSVQNDTYKRKKEKKDIYEDESSRIIGNNKSDMGWKKNQGDNTDIPDLDFESREEIETDESKRDRETKALNVKIRANLKLIEGIRGIPFGVGQDMNFHVKKYRELMHTGWSHEGIISAFMEVAESDHWKEEKKNGNYPGMNTVQFHLRNKKPV